MLSHAVACSRFIFTREDVSLHGASDHVCIGALVSDIQLIATTYTTSSNKWFTILRRKGATAPTFPKHTPQQVQKKTAIESFGICWFIETWNSATGWLVTCQYHVICIREDELENCHSNSYSLLHSSVMTEIQNAIHTYRLRSRRSNCLSMRLLPSPSYTPKCLPLERDGAKT